jgi:hypothetical protein
VVQPSNGRLEPGGAVRLTATLAAGDPGALSGELQIMMAPRPLQQQEQAGDPAAAGGGGAGGGDGGGAGWLKEPAARCPVGASVVACTYEVLEEGGCALKAVRARRVAAGA